jgi:hypothetical protein
MGGVERDVMDMLPPGHDVNLGCGSSLFNGKLARTSEVPHWIADGCC